MRGLAAAVLAAGLALGGCQVSGGGLHLGDAHPGQGYGWGPPSARSGSIFNDRGFGRSDAPSIRTLNGGARAALKDGCHDRYAHDRRKYQACVYGRRHSADALAVGCAKRYAHDGRKMRRCMNGG